MRAHPRSPPPTNRPSHTDRIKSLIAPDEPLTPGILYVGVATLTGSVLARNHSLALRLALPPTLLLLSLNHFLPKTSANVAAYAGALEDAYLPTLAEKHDIARAHSAMAWDRAKDAAAAGRERVGEGVDVVQADVALAPLQAGNVGAVQTSSLGQPFLGEAGRQAQGADAATKHQSVGRMTAVAGVGHDGPR